MRALARLLAFAVVALLVTSCMTPVGAGAFGQVPLDAPAKCSDYCSKMGLTLGAVVIMAGNVGCVCTPLHGGGSSAREAAPATAGGMVAILIQQQQARAAQQQQQQRNSTH
ncbi:MAG TPA: hypothetical protein VMI75_20795 [Polyangiaceae bacterium]|nr:hypothetical protein [Polyangiaceae bacterium]